MKAVFRDLQTVSRQDPLYLRFNKTIWRDLAKELIYYELCPLLFPIPDAVRYVHVI